MESDSELQLEKNERENVQIAISQVETALAVSTPGTRQLLEIFLSNARGRLGTLDKKIRDAEEKRETQLRTEAALLSQAQREVALSQEEKESYNGFLKEDFFSKKDFSRLEDFYRRTWDRLSEAGKDEMSHRIWEGVRREEYTFGELSATVREKETKRAYQILKEREGEPACAKGIPEADRADFIRAYEGGMHGEAQKILERESFRNGMFLGAESKSIKHALVDVGRDADGGKIGEKIAFGNSPAKDSRLPAKDGDSAALDVASLRLDDVKMIDAPETVSSANLAKNTEERAKSGNLLRGG